MDLNLLKVFVKVAELGGFSAAARELGMQRSAVSRRVAALEDALGVRLLLRSTRRVSTTTAGMRLLREVKPLLQSLEDVVCGLPERAQVPAGELRLTAPTDIGTRLLPPVLGELIRRFPALHPRVHLTNRVVDLEGEGFDVALRVRMGPLEDSNLRIRRLGDVTMALYASTDYIEAYGRPESLDDLARHVLIGFPNNPLRLPAAQRILVDDMAMASAFVIQGSAIALLPHFYVAQEIAAGLLHKILPTQGFGAGTLYAVFPSTRALPPKVTAFRDALLAYLDAHPLFSESQAAP